MKTGVNTSTVINIRKKRNQWQRKGKARCTSCEHFYYGYYCNKQKRSAEHYDKPKHTELEVIVYLIYDSRGVEP